MMNLDEGTTAEKRRRKPWLLIGAGGVAALALLIGGCTLSSRPAPAPVVAEHTPTPDPTPTPEATPEAHEHEHEGSEASTSAWSTAMAFLDAWRTEDITDRDRLLGETATLRLHQLLMHMDPMRRQMAPIESVEVVSAGPYSTVFLVRQVDVPAPSTLTLVRDPDTGQGWLVNSVEK